LLIVAVEETQGPSNDAFQAGREWMQAAVLSRVANHDDEDATENGQLPVLGALVSSGLVLSLDTKKVTKMNRSKMGM